MSDWLIVTMICLVSIAGAGLWLRPNKQKIGFSRDLLRPGSRRDQVYLFDGTQLLDRTENGNRANQAPIFDWDGLRRALAVEFPGFPTTPDEVRSKGEIIVPPIDGNPDRDILCEWVDGIVRVHLRTLFPGKTSGSSYQQDPLRVAMDKAPYPVWYLNKDNQVRWCNRAYTNLARTVRGQDPDLNTPLFSEEDIFKPPSKKTRVAISTPDQGHKLWFDVSIVSEKEGNLCYAVDTNAVVDAELAQRNFVQTLAKTFAQLSIGLAIFDRNRQLALFNPALIDLIALPAEFLSGRPDLFGFFDRLRDQNMMPEPKNYSSWRHQLDDLLEAAVDGHYQETWSLPSGSVYSVSGRPHPDGAVAFLFEDITAEITLTRRFRSELELGQSMMDRLDDAVATFSADGTLAFSNRSYHQLWQVDPDLSFAQITVQDATKIWQDQCIATPVWGRIRDFVDLRDNRIEWSAMVTTRDGVTLSCTISPVQGGATMVRFQTNSTVNQPIQQAQLTD
jgi:PAS domain-containing protein